LSGWKLLWLFDGRLHHSSPDGAAAPSKQVFRAKFRFC
jgi:hypothetical protein